MAIANLTAQFPTGEQLSKHYCRLESMFSTEERKHHNVEKLLYETGGLEARQDLLSNQSTGMKTMANKGRAMPGCSFSGPRYQGET